MGQGDARGAEEEHGRVYHIAGGKQGGDALAHGEIVDGAVGVDQEERVAGAVVLFQQAHLDGLDARLDLHVCGLTFGIVVKERGSHQDH